MRTVTRMSVRMLGVLLVGSWVSAGAWAAVPWQCSADAGVTMPCAFGITDTGIQLSSGAIKFQARVAQAKMPIPEGVLLKVSVNLTDAAGIVKCTQNFNDVKVMNSILNLDFQPPNCVLDDVVATTPDLRFQLVLSGAPVKSIPIGTVPYSLKANRAVKAQEAHLADIAAQAYYAHRITSDRETLTAKSIGKGYFDFFTPPTGGSLYPGENYTPYVKDGFMQWAPVDSSPVLHLAAKGVNDDKMSMLDGLFLESVNTTAHGTVVVAPGPQGGAPFGLTVQSRGIDVTGGATIRNHAKISEGLEVTGGATVAGGARISEGATISGGAHISNGAFVSNGASIDGGAYIEGGAIVKDGLNAFGGSRLFDGAWVNGGLTVETGGAVVNGPTRLNNGATVVGGMTVVNGGVDVSGGSAVKGAATFADGVTVNNGLQVATGYSSFAAGAKVSSGLSVEGGETIIGTLSVSGASEMNGGARVSGGLVVSGGGADVTGLTTLRSGVTVTGGLEVTIGQATLGGGVRVVGQASFADGAVIGKGLQVTSGNTVLSGGVAVAGLTEANGGAKISGGATIIGPTTFGVINATNADTVEFYSPVKFHAGMTIDTAPPQEAWQTVSSGWLAGWGQGSTSGSTAAWVTTYGPVSYMKDSMGFVHVRGLAVTQNAGGSAVTHGLPMFTLPVGYRPKFIQGFVARDGSAGFVHRIAVSPDGTVSCDTCSTAASVYTVDLSPVTFELR